MLKEGPFDKIFIDYKFWFLIILISICLVNVAAFIYHKHLNRNLHVKLQYLSKIEGQLSTTRSMLILEKSTLESHLRIENFARNNLNMINPSKVEMVTVVDNGH
jgi:cell division protein FtsL